MIPAIRCIQVSKHFKEVKALCQLDLEVEQGELFGFIGPDGSGKTTLLRILSSLMQPDEGLAQLLGFDCAKDYREIRNQICYMPGRFSLYQDLTVAENLNFYASVFEVDPEDNYELIASVFEQLRPFSNRRAGKLSGGMKQKLALSCALIHKPKLLILDEPTTGVDAVSRVEFWNTLKDLRNEGMTILVSTPYMDEANKCDRICLMNQGSILRVASPNDILQSFDYQLLSVTGSDRYQLLKLLKNNNKVQDAYLFGQSVHISLRPDIDLDTVFENPSYASLNAEFSPIPPTIEDCFISFIRE